MSQATRIGFILNRSVEISIRNEIKKERVLGYHKKHLEKLNALIEEGGREYIGKEIAEIEELLNNVERYLDINVNEAKELSMSAGVIIYNTWSLLKVAKKRAEDEAAIEKIKRVKEKAVCSQKRKAQLLEKINGIGNSLFKSFVREELNKLREELAECSNLDSFEKSLEAKLDSIKIKGKNEEQNWKEKKQKEQEAEVKKAVIEELREEVKSESDIIAILDLSEDKDIKTMLKESEEKLEEKAFDEAIRKEVVVDIMKVLKKQGFIVSNPKVRYGKVSFLGRKPSGKFAEFKVNLDGKFTYRFDNYEGSSCKADIGDFEEKLSEIYGVKILDKEITWENPDKISKGAIDINDSLKK